MEKLLLVIKKYKWFILTILFWIILYLLIIIFDNKYEFLPWSDIKLYEKIASEVFEGKIPYIHTFSEYPPASFIVFIIPRIFVEGMVLYRRLFEICNLLYGIGTVFVASQAIKLIKKSDWKYQLVFQSIALLILSQLLLGKYDAFPMFFTSLGVYFYLYSEKENKQLFQKLAYAIITFAGLTKLYPLVILPILFVKEFKQKKYKDLIKNIIICVITTLPFLIQVLSGLDGISWFLNYHENRGLEIESTYSSVLLLLNQLGLINDVSIVYTHASYGISGTLTNFFSSLSLLIFLASYFVLILIAFFQDWSKDVSKKIIQFSLLTIGTFVITNKVFSAQYILWFFPYLMIVPFLYGKKTKGTLITATLISCVLTVMIYPIFWLTFNKGHLGLTTVLLIRNALLVFILLYTVLKVKPIHPVK